MPNQQIIDYINQRRQAGATDDEIKHGLLSAGWPESEINQYLGPQQENKQEQNPDVKKCPHCQKEIPSLADKCPYCQSDLRVKSWSRRHPILAIFLVIFGPIVITFILTSSQSPESVRPTTTPSQPAAIPSKLEEIQRIAEEYYKTHTYTSNDFYVCSDMAMDVWNLIKTQGINARICAGNVEEDISAYIKPGSLLKDSLVYLNKMNHAWVLAETDSFKYVAVETTGGYLVWGKGMSGGQSTENDLYYAGECFDAPKQFKSFLDARTTMINTCNEAISMENYWNANYVGKMLTAPISEYKGKMNQKEQECINVLNEMKGLRSSYEYKGETGQQGREYSNIINEMEGLISSFISQFRHPF